VLSLEDSWRLETDAQLQELQSALNLSGDATTTRDAALAMLARRLAKAPASNTVTSTTTTQTGPTTAARSTAASTPGSASLDALTALEKAGFLGVIDGDASAFQTFPALTPTVLVITGDKSHFAGTDLSAAFVRSLTAAKLPTVLAAAYEPGNDVNTAPDRGDAIAPVLDDQTLSRAASTVDDIELVQGRVAAVLALQAISGGNLKNVGHYGYGSGAAAPLPPHQS
jgi:hypothetical protein